VNIPSDENSYPDFIEREAEQWHLDVLADAEARREEKASSEEIDEMLERLDTEEALSVVYENQGNTTNYRIGKQETDK